MSEDWVKARVLEASDRDYSAAVLSLLDQAEKEIVLSFYLVEPDDDAGPWHPVNRLMESLLRACQRGVTVRIYLNTNFRFHPQAGVGRGNYFERLLRAGAEITSLLPRRRLHDKLLVIDTRYVIEGSTNWSVDALKSNFESDTVIDSPEHARKKLARIARFTLPPPPDETQIDRPLAPLPETVEIPKVIFEKDYLPRMIRTSDDRAMDLYLLLLGQAAALGNSNLALDLETAGRALGLPPDWDRARVRRQMIKVLRKLANRYGWLEVEFPFARNAAVRLKPFPGETVPVPGRLLGADFLSEKSTGEVFLALAGELLKAEGIEINALSSPALERRFGVGATTLLRARGTVPGGTVPRGTGLR